MNNEVKVEVEVTLKGIVSMPDGYNIDNGNDLLAYKKLITQYLNGDIDLLWHGMVCVAKPDYMLQLHYSPYNNMVCNIMKENSAIDSHNKKMHLVSFMTPYGERLVHVYPDELINLDELKKERDTLNHLINSYLTGERKEKAVTRVNEIDLIISKISPDNSDSMCNVTKLACMNCQPVCDSRI